MISTNEYMYLNKLVHSHRPAVHLVAQVLLMVGVSLALCHRQSFSLLGAPLNVLLRYRVVKGIAKLSEVGETARRLHF